MKITDLFPDDPHPISSGIFGSSEPPEADPPEPPEQDPPNGGTETGKEVAASEPPATPPAPEPPEAGGEITPDDLILGKYKSEEDLDKALIAQLIGKPLDKMTREEKEALYRNNRALYLQAQNAQVTAQKQAVKTTRDKLDELKRTAISSKEMSAEDRAKWNEKFLELQTEDPLAAMEMWEELQRPKTAQAVAPLIPMAEQNIAATEQQILASEIGSYFYHNPEAVEHRELIGQIMKANAGNPELEAMLLTDPQGLMRRFHDHAVRVSQAAQAKKQHEDQTTKTKAAATMPVGGGKTPSRPGAAPEAKQQLLDSIFGPPEKGAGIFD